MSDKLQPTPSSFGYFEAIFKNSAENNILLIDEKGIIISVNKAFTNYFGYTQEDVAGKYFSMLFTEEDVKAGKPEKELKSVLGSGQAFDNNYLVSKDKTATWVSGESVLVKKEKNETRIVKIIQNINKQKTSEARVSRLDELNEKILKSIEDAVVVLDKDLNILLANDAFNALFKLDNKKKELLSFPQLIQPYDAFGEIIRNINNTCISRKGFSNTPIEIETTTGEKKIFDVSCNSMEHEDDKDNVLVVIHDITVYTQVRREREDIIGFVAHELRNPLANLVLCNELLCELIKENDPEAMDDVLQRSKNNVSRLNKMIAELYDATKVNSGNLKLDIASFNFSEMIKEAIDTVEVLQPSYNIIVTGDGNVDAHGDRYRLIQVVTNFLSNGIKYSNGKTDVLLHISYDAEWINVSVKDNGLGITPKQLPFIFERFFRAEKTKNLEGIGLGLYLCRQIIHEHHGKIWAESEEGKGSVFYFSIPRQLHR